MNEEQKTEEPQSVGLAEALEQMNEDGNPPTGFHMMLFSEDFTLKDSCWWF